MESVIYLLNGFGEVITPSNLLIVLLGSLLGTLVGVLPGLGPTSAIAILLPVTTVLNPAQGLMMMAGIYYGSMYGGSTTAILMNIPGESSSVPTTLDGYPLAKKGRAGAALGIAAIGSFIAGIIGLVGLILFAPFLANQALKFGPPEYFTLMLFALLILFNLTGFSLKKSAIMGLLGFLFSLVGIGLTTGQPRFDFGFSFLTGGFEMISIIIGLFAIAEVLKGLEENRSLKVPKKPVQIRNIYPSKNDLKQSSFPILRGSVLGFFLGILPGVSATITAFLAYDLEKKVSKNPEKFGKGAIEGVAGPESANNATSSGGFIPLLSLGLPSSPPLAVLLAALMIYGLTPGPILFEQNGQIVWTIIASMFVGNVILLILNLPLVGLWAKLTDVPFGIMAPIILLISFVGAYSVRNSMFDVVVAIIFGVLGYLFNKFRWPIVPFILCLVLGPKIETYFLQSLEMSSGKLSIFVQRPISLTILLLAVIILIVSIILMKRTKRRILQETGEQMEIS
ncbi:tripartite tricarboxylate transporter permease [Terrilactibacillus sp. BCM23-1]|uniref:Tripartite tricarboxylate transporter permease n=1 Tax=Terrilactibacillus tamarindi TaxID=2599694 RepID=A0A6N8CQ59_9BACI|nr:tripartite tricarboxylate transporter permease [Terrilactibacillus tamarindi]MTT32329.1 tripartite tricarboxylate transporter permease [Terrilactibacillus tamarindi]